MRKTLASPSRFRCATIIIVEQNNTHVSCNNYEREISKIMQETNLSSRCIESSRTIATIQCAVISAAARRGERGGGFSVKREIKSEGTRGGISTEPRWWRCGRDWRKRRRSSHDTQRATMEPISAVVERWHS